MNSLPNYPFDSQRNRTKAHFIRVFDTRALPLSARVQHRLALAPHQKPAAPRAPSMCCKVIAHRDAVPSKRPTNGTPRKSSTKHPTADACAGSAPHRVFNSHGSQVGEAQSGRVPPAAAHRPATRVALARDRHRTVDRSTGAQPSAQAPTWGNARGQDVTRAAVIHAHINPAAHALTKRGHWAFTVSTQHHRTRRWPPGRGRA